MTWSLVAQPSRSVQGTLWLSAPDHLCCAMSVRRSARVWPFLVLALLLFRLPYVNFCGMSSRSARPCRIGNGVLGFGRKSEQPMPSSSNMDISDMDISAVSDWLDTLALGQYGPHFQNASVDGTMLANLTDEDLQEMGINHGVHRKKILGQHRDELVAKGWKETSSGDLWKPEIKEASHLEVNRYAEDVLQHLSSKGLDIEINQRVLVKRVDKLLCAKMEQRDLFNLLEALNDIAWSHTALVRQGDQDVSGSVRGEIQKDQRQILQQGNALQQRIMAVLGATQQLAVAMFSYAKPMKKKMSDSQRMLQFADRVQAWQEKMLALAESAFICQEDMVQRVSDRLLSLPGGSAVRANLEMFSKLIEEKEKAAEKCKRIYDLANRDVQLALTGREGGLETMIRNVEKDLRSLEQRQIELEEQRTKLEALKEENQESRVKQQNATKQIRDWHIMRFWRSAWKEEMEVYENQVEKDEERRKADDQTLDEKLQETERELRDIITQKAKLQEEIDDLKGKNSMEFWNNTLEAEGLLSAELEVKEKEELLRILRDQFFEAVKKTGVANPELAATIIVHHETSKTLLSEAEEKASVAATGMQELLDDAKEIIENSGDNLDGLATALLNLAEAHEEQIRSRKKSKSREEAVKRSLALTSGASFLDSSDLNRTLTA